MNDMIKQTMERYKVTEEIKKEVTISDDGVGMFDGFFPSNLCNDYINYFDEREKAGFTHDRWSSNSAPKTDIDDLSVSLPNGKFLTEMEVLPLSNVFLDIFWKDIYSAYHKKFAILEKFDKHHIGTLKIQKTEPGQGYHIWHTESSGKIYSHRVLTFVLYLNDVKEGGETEFLYLKRRVNAKKNRLLLWPAGFTHTHRGNPPLAETKYILTGWVEFI